MSVWNVLYEFKFNSRGDAISHEKLDVQLSKKIERLIKGSQAISSRQGSGRNKNNRKMEVI
jgi:hypothetical protein